MRSVTRSLSAASESAKLRNRSTDPLKISVHLFLGGHSFQHRHFQKLSGDADVLGANGSGNLPEGNEN